MDVPRIRVLCVDDNDIMAEAVRRKLDHEPDMSWLGWRADARDLLEAVRELKPDVILLDVDMPYRDSFDAITEVSAGAPDVRIVVLSGHLRLPLIEQAMDAGAMGYISKNEDPEVIIRAIRSVMQGEFALGPETAAELRRIVPRRGAGRHPDA